MSTRAELPSDPPPARLGSSRESVLACLHEAGAPLSVADVAAATGLHPNTVRFHLDGLVGLGHADRQVEERTSRGRPRVLYAARPQAGGARKYQLLASVLAGVVQHLDADGRAVAEAGRALGRELAGGTSDLTEEEVLRLLDEVMARVGFEPELDDGATDLRLHHCPFLEVAEERSHVVCGLHQGLIEGALGEGPVRLEQLQPFATPDVCVARLTRRRRK